MPLLIKASPGGENFYPPSPPPETIPLPLASRKFAFTTFDADNNAPHAHIIITLSFTRARCRVYWPFVDVAHSAEFIQRRNSNFSDKRFNMANEILRVVRRIPTRIPRRWENIFPASPRPVKSLSATKYVHYRGTRNISLFRIEKLWPWVYPERIYSAFFSRARYTTYSSTVLAISVIVSAVK